MAKIIGAAEFEAEVIKSDIPVLVDFFADWCGPCKAIAPVLDELSDDFEGKAKVLKIDVGENKELATQYGVRSIPNMIFFKNGEVSGQIVGLVDKSELVDKLNSLS